MKAVTAEESDSDDAQELTAEELLTDETATAQELHSDEADELTITSTPEPVLPPVLGSFNEIVVALNLWPPEEDSTSYRSLGKKPLDEISLGFPVHAFLYASDLASIAKL